MANILGFIIVLVLDNIIQASLHEEISFLYEGKPMIKLQVIVIVLHTEVFL